MKIYADSYFRQGSSHAVCQDYAYHTNRCVVVSDGCSTAKHSDVGARILTHQWTNLPQSILPNLEKHIDYFLCQSDYNICDLNLPSESLAATLLSLTYNENNKSIDLLMAGDGLVVSRKGYHSDANANKELEFFNLSFESGAPYYLKYNLNNERQTYLDQFGDCYAINGVVQPHGYFEDYPDGVVYKSFSLAEYDLVAVFSDGINTFQHLLEVDYKDIVEDILAIKGFAGSFLQRRCQKAFKEFNKLGYEHYDDLAVGVIKVDIT